MLSAKILDYAGHYSLDRLNPTIRLYAQQPDYNALAEKLDRLSERIKVINNNVNEADRFEQDYIKLVKKYFYYNPHIAGLKRHLVEKGVSLADLWSSEDLPDERDIFIDQEYIDFLNVNPDRITEMNWRKFEGLTAEYFKRTGYIVEIGKGRGDGGVDVIAKKIKDHDKNPERILIQCKRYGSKNSVAINEVKALYFDIVDKDYDRGIMITTSKIAKGGMDIISSGLYPMSAIQGNKVKEMISNMARFSAKNTIESNKRFRLIVNKLGHGRMYHHLMLPTQLMFTAIGDA